MTVRELRLGVALACPKITLRVESRWPNTLPSSEDDFQGTYPNANNNLWPRNAYRSSSVEVGIKIRLVELTLSATLPITGS